MNNISKIKIALSVLLISIATISCASKKLPEPKERSDTFIADVNPFEIGTFHLYTGSSNLGKLKISDIYLSFDPRTNCVMATGRIGVNAVRLGFSYEERKSLLAAIETYCAAVEALAIPKAKPTKKNAYSTGNVSIEWGALGLSHYVMTNYITNAEYIEENKPYFRILLNQTEDERTQVSSPKIFIYISPAQWDKIVEACNQERLVAMTDQIMIEAEAF